jgi:hypothetical protein
MAAISPPSNVDQDKAQVIRGHAPEVSRTL